MELLQGHEMLRGIVWTCNTIRYERTDWLIEQGLMSPPTQYWLSGRRFYSEKDRTNSIKVLKEQKNTQITQKYNKQKKHSKSLVYTNNKYGATRWKRNVFERADLVPCWSHRETDATLQTITSLHSRWHGATSACVTGVHSSRHTITTLCHNIVLNHSLWATR